MHTAVKTRKFLDDKNIQTLPHPPYSPDLAPADFFLFPTVKAGLAGESIGSGSVKMAWERVVGGLPKEAFTKAHQKWHDCHMKCVCLDGDYVEKISKKVFYGMKNKKN